ncbi:MAG: NAD(P)H-binding protein [candidate division Zixibacteria bacterium]|nr:NAD(P)H-binding protein [candidate division Zixibacteria bacterium]
MANDDKTILVIGGTGMLGQPVVDMLDHFCFSLKIFSRSPDKAKKIFGKNFEIVKGDIGDSDSLKRAMSGCYGVHINLKGGPKPKDFDRIEHHGTKAIVSAAMEMGIKRITYLSGCSVARERCQHAMIKAKYDAEQAIINSGLEYSIFRAAWFMESLPLFIRDNQAAVLGKQPHKLHWLAAEDYAKMTAKSYMQDEAVNKVLTVFGPETYTMKEALEIFCKIAYPEAKVTNVPLGVLSFIAAIKFSKQLKEVLMIMKYFEQTGEYGNPSEADELLGSPQITLEKWSKAYKESMGA